MGRKKEAATEEAPKETEKKPEETNKEKEDDKKEEEVEDTPIVKELKKLDDEYLKLEKEYEKECQVLRKKYTEKQRPFLEQRTAKLTAPEEGATATGTPACKGFWLQAMKNEPNLGERIEEWDEPVLEYIKDITYEYLDEEDDNKGFTIKFHFAENPYFTNTVLTKTLKTEETNPYNQEMECKAVESTVIDWKPGKDVTVEKVAKKVKGGGAKKAKQKKEREEPRESFFRNCFRSLKVGDPLPEDINAELEGLDEEDMEEGDEGIISMLLDSEYQICSAFKDTLIPFAVRWYTGEAAPEDDGEDDDDEDEEEEDDDDEDEDESDDEPAPKKKGGSAGKKGKGKGGQESNSTETKEECKQQ